MSGTVSQRGKILRVIRVSKSDTWTDIRYGPMKGNQPLGRRLPTEKNTNAKKKTSNACLKVIMRRVRVTTVVTEKKQ